MYESGDVARKIADRAAEKGVVISAMLKDTGLGRNTMTNMRNGSAIASASLAKIADYLDCSVDYLLDRTAIKEVATQSAKNLPSDEAELLARYRSLDEDGKLSVRACLLREWRRVGTETEKGAAIGKQSSAV